MMKSMKKILALLVCFSMIMTCSPAVQLFTHADSGYVTAFEDTMGYESFEDASNWQMTNKTYADGQVDSDGNIVMMQTDSKFLTNSGTSNSNATGALKMTFPESVIAEDTVNRTKLLNNGKFKGKVQVDISYMMDMKYLTEYEGVSLPEPQYNIRAAGNGEAMIWRLRTASINALNHSSQGAGDTLKKTFRATNTAGVENSVHTLVDTDTDKLKMWVNNDDTNYVEGDVRSIVEGSKDLEYLSNIYVSGFDRMAVGSNIAITNVKVSTIPSFTSAEEAILNSLPEKLADDVNSVKSDISLPSISGVKWSSSDESVISNTGVVTRSKEGSRDAVLKASFTVNEIEYTKEYAMTVAKSDNIITYYVDGEKYNTLEVSDGNKASDISAPQKDHYTFKGWYTDGADTAFDFTSAIYDNVNLYAKYEPATYTVSFYADGSLVGSLTGKYGNPVDGTLPDIPAKSGYTAICWIIGDTGTVFNKNTLVDGNMTVNAKYETGTLNRYTVTYNVDGVKYSEDTVYEGYSTTFPDPPAKEHYVFTKWQLNGADYSETSAVTSNITLDAVFSPEEVAVTFYDDDKTTKLYDGIGYYNTEYGTLPASPSKSGGYAFTGWVTDDNTSFNSSTIVTEPISVYATYESTVKVIVDQDLTKLNTIAQAKGWTFKNTAYTTSGISPEGGIQLTQIASSPNTSLTTQNTSQETLLGAVLEGILSQDDDNRTTVTTSRFIGKYEVELEFERNILEGIYPDDYTGPKNPSYAYLYFGYTSGTDGTATQTGPLSYRIGPSSLMALNAASVSAASLNKGFSLPKGEVATLHLVLDTKTDKVTTWVNDSTSNSATGNFYTACDYFNSFRILTMPRFGIGTYIRLKRVKVTQLEVDTENADYKACMEKLASLPDKLMNDPYNVTGNITMPSIEGVTWSTSNSAIVNTNGTVNRWYDDYDVTLTAAVAAGNYKFAKNYTVTVKQKDGINRAVKMNSIFSSKDDMADWSFVNVGSNNDGKYSVNSEGVKIEKVTASSDLATSKESKTYYAYLDLYGTEDEYDDASRSETLSNTYKGVYDIDLSTLASVTSKAPATISIGYRGNGKFVSAGAFKYANGSLKFVYNTTPENVQTIDISGDISSLHNLKLRIDTVNRLIWVLDGDLLLNEEAVSFYNNFEDGEEFMFNCLRIGVDKNNDFGDYVVVKSAKVTQLEPKEIADRKSALDAAKLLTIDTVIDTGNINPDSASGYINDLPSTIGGGYSVTWTANTDQIDMQNGEIFHDSTETNAVISAYITNPSSAYSCTVRKDFHITIRAAQNESELTKYEINSLGKITNQPYSDIRYDLSIPQVSGITWTSSDTNVITNDGKINRSALLTDDAEVTITASKNGISKEYPLTVKKYAPFETLYTDTSVSDGTTTFTVNGYDNVRVAVDTLSTIKFVKSAEGTISFVDSDGTSAVKVNVTDEGVSFDCVGSVKTVYPVSDGTEVTIQVYLMPETGRAAIWMNGVMVEDWASIDSEFSELAGFNTSGTGLGINEIKVQADGYKMLQINVDNLPYFEALDTGYVSADINLLTDTVTGAAAVWTSSDESLITNTGTVNNPDVMTFVTVTLTLTDPNDSGIKNVYVKSVAVDCDESRNIAGNASVSVSGFDTLSNPKENLNDNDITTKCEIKVSGKNSTDIIYDFGAKSSFNTVYVNEAYGVENYTISVSSDGTAWTNVKSGAITDVLSRLIFFNSAASARYMKFTAEQCESTVGINEIKVYMIASAKELAEIDLSLLTLGVTSTTTDITLPAVGVNGTVFKWTSSNTDIIGTDGKVTRPVNSTTVKLTASVDGISKVKTFDIYVEGTKGPTGPSVITGGGSGSGGGGGTGSSVNVGSSGFIGSINPGDTFTAGQNVPSNITGTYTDVSKDVWYYEPVEKLTSLGVVSGDGTGRFNPEESVTREQFVKMLIIATGTEIADEVNDFEDVVSGEWYEQYILTAKANGIVNGITDTTFGIGTNISRQDMAVLIARLLEKKGYTFEKTSDVFADDAQISDYANDAVYAMKSIGLINGFGGAFNPKSNLTRAEAAQVIASLVELLNADSSDEADSEAEGV